MDGDAIRTHPLSLAVAQGSADRPAAGADPMAALLATLCERGSLSQEDITAARVAQRGLDAPLDDILLAKGKITEPDVLRALSDQYGLGVSDLDHAVLDPTLAALLPVQTAIAQEAVAWRRSGGQVVFAISRPQAMEAIRAALPPGQTPIFTLATRAQIQSALTALYGPALARQAEARTPAAYSCRTWRRDRALRRVLVMALVGAVLVALWPLAVGLALMALTLLVFYANMGLKIAAFAAALRGDRLARMRPSPPHQSPTPLHMPVVSILVPLFKEREIAETLITTLSKLRYPAERLDVILVTEADDPLTQAAIERCVLPPWMRAIRVPPGQPRTKPRALNFALNFARGSIIGIYDAEDRPDADQITRVVQRFAELPPEVACLQGRLDYYNSTHNGMARCFAVEYATWFRVLLPGVQRMGLFVPLGGTTLFLRRSVLEKLGAWDAHNVTEDADLGLRLARHGYRTEIVETTTFEEANAAIWPWIKQRTRWQKGYLMTWATAMRRPGQLWRDLGAWRFWGFQVQVLGAVLGCILAPVLWSLWVIPFGLPHPIQTVLTPAQFAMVAASLIFSLVLSLAVSIYATRARHLRKLRAWVLLVELYHGLGTLAAWRAGFDMLAQPFFWSKTVHGRFGGIAPSETAEHGPARAR